MNRPERNVGRDVGEMPDDRAEVADLAARTSALKPHQRRPLMKWFLLFVAWAVTCALIVIAVLRIFDHDGWPALAVLNAFTRYVYLPAYLLLVVSLWKRRWWLAVANAAVIACHLFWLTPDFIPDRRFAAAAANPAGNEHRHSLRIFFANVRMLNRDYAALWQEIQEADPDIVVLVEFYSTWRDAYLKSPLPATYPYDSGLDQIIIESIIVSKLPLKSITYDWFAHRCVETIDMPIGSQTLRVVGLHSPRPVDESGTGNDYASFWNQAMPLLLGESHPLIVLGDFNATQYSRVYKQLKSSGLRSAHEDRGRGYATTWPNGTLLIPPIRIDQAFLSSDVVCRAISEGRGTGSDHKPLILDIQIDDRP